MASRKFTSDEGPNKALSNLLQEIAANWRETRAIMDEREERRIVDQRRMSSTLEKAQKEIEDVPCLSRELQGAIL